MRYQDAEDHEVGLYLPRHAGDRGCAPVAGGAASPEAPARPTTRQADRESPPVLFPIRLGVPLQDGPPLELVSFLQATAQQGRERPGEVRLCRPRSSSGLGGRSPASGAVSATQKKGTVKRLSAQECCQ